MANLDELRRRIDEVDRRLTELLVERFAIAAEIGLAKEGLGLSVYDPDRERRVLERVSQAAAGRVPAERVAAIFREIISASRAHETVQSVLVLGEWGGLAHQAALQRFGASAKVESSPRPQDLFARLDEGSGEYAVVSLEGHSFEASLDRLDLFLHSDVRVFAEYAVEPRLGLYADPASQRTGPVFATAAALAQVSRWMGAQGPEREFRVAGSVTDAIRLAGASDGAVVGHPLLETVGQLRPVEQVIEDVPEATRRFFVLARRALPPSGRDKTLLLLVLANRPGSLHSVAGIFAHEGLNVCWLEPKPTHLGPWDHLFVIEIEGHEESPEVQRALSALRGSVELLRVLGSYPAEAPRDRMRPR
ncbi:MAG: chorismate mutase [Candidatus Eisenbacteria bacterium]|nr:chorismate mutase [Candidatus Eisenbacteria bacterium]MCC7141761.1 chorismate mutase [Candidatus Eisenbacteria bacterium]